MPAITEVHAREILDSRGNPTVEVDVTVDGGFGRASVPSGASTGSREALELRDGGKRYCGKGVRNAVAWVNTMIADSVVGHNWPTQQSLDVHMCWLDGTADKHKLGANAILGVSTAFARATAAAGRRPLYAYFADMLSLHAAGKAPAVQMPVPMMNIINGGAHAANGLAVQEFMIVPVGAPTFAEALRYGAEIFHALGSHLRQQGLATSVGDEGGFAPDLSDNEAALDAIATAVTTVGLRFGDDIALALDIAASEFHHDDMYVLPRRRYTTDAFIDYLDKLVDAYPVLSIEDGLAEDDWEGWAQLTTRLGNRVQLVGDDLFVTNAAMLERGIKAGVANAVLVKINQIGTITETMATIAKAHAGGYRAVVSHRSGETEDVTIADLAVGCGVGQIKTGSLCRSDRVAKYNQLLRIEEATNAPYPGRAAFAH